MPLVTWSHRCSSRLSGALAAKRARSLQAPKVKQQAPPSQTPACFLGGLPATADTVKHAAGHLANSSSSKNCPRCIVFLACRAGSPLSQIVPKNEECKGAGFDKTTGKGYREAALLSPGALSLPPFAGTGAEACKGLHKITGLGAPSHLLMSWPGPTHPQTPRPERRPQQDLTFCSPSPFQSVHASPRQCQAQGGDKQRQRASTPGWRTRLVICSPHRLSVPTASLHRPLYVPDNRGVRHLQGQAFRVSAPGGSTWVPLLWGCRVSGC